MKIWLFALAAVLFAETTTKLVRKGACPLCGGHGAGCILCMPF